MRVRPGLGTLCLCLWLFLGPADSGAGERVLALAPHIVETLHAVGAGDQIVGAVRFSDHPPAARRHPTVGSYKRVTPEAALRLEPTLAIAMDESVAGLAPLKAAGVPVEYSHPKTIEAVLEDIVRLGTRVGCEVRARQVAEGLRIRLEALRQRRPSPPPRVFYEVWHAPLITAGGRSFISDALREIGMENVFAGIPLDSPRIGVEAVLRAAPSVIIFPADSRDLSRRRSFWQRWFRAAPPPGFVEAAHDLLHRPGPRLIEGMERLQEDILRVTGRGVTDRGSAVRRRRE